MKVQIILVPYDSGSKDTRMGRGPACFLESGLVDILRKDGHQVELDSIDLENPPSTELESALELNRQVSLRFRKAVADRSFPLLFSGSSICSVGALPGVPSSEKGLIWFDGHGDFNTPETSTSGSIDGMALAVATGRCLRGPFSTISGFQPVPEHNVILIGAREFDPEEKRLLDSSGVALVSRSFIRSMNIVEALKPAINDLQDRVSDVHVHLDLDVLDPARTPSNQFAPPDGLSVGAVEIALRLIEGRFNISSACIAAYDPECDPQKATVQAGMKLVQTLLRRTK